MQCDRLMKMSNNESDFKHFFDSFPEFYDNEYSGRFPNRLNNRFLALIENNRKIISNSSILDIASQDGRWSFAALKVGASHVTGVEARKEHVIDSLRKLKKYNIPQEKFRFVHGDIFQEIKKFDTNKFNVIFCFGFFYHVIDHIALLSEIKRLNPKYLILDTRVSNLEESVIELREENSVSKINALKNQSSSNDMVLVGTPSKSALELMLTNLGFEFTYYDWKDKSIKNWERLEDYENNQRISLTARNNNY